MSTASMFVVSGKKLTGELEKAIQAALKNKRFVVALDQDEVADGKITNPVAVEKKVARELVKVAPGLEHAQKLVFKPTMKLPGAVKLMVETDTERAVPCQLELQAPVPKTKAAMGKHVIDPLYGKAKFDDLLDIRHCRATLDFSVRHASPGRIADECQRALAAFETRAVGEVEDAISKTVGRLSAGLQSKGSKGMGWKDAKKLVELLNKDVQRVINSLADQGNAELAKLMKARLPGAEAACTVVAMFSKFDIMGHVHFPGGNKPLVSETSIDKLADAVADLDKSAKAVDTATDQLEAAADAFCLAHRTQAKALKQPKEPADDRSSRGMEPPLAKDAARAIADSVGPKLQGQIEALRKQLATTVTLLDQQVAHADDLVDAVGKMRKLLEKEKLDGKPDDAVKTHKQVKGRLDEFRKYAETFAANLKERRSLCTTLELRSQAPRCFEPESEKKIQDAATALQDKPLGFYTKKMIAMFDKATDPLKQ